MSVETPMNPILPEIIINRTARNLESLHQFIHRHSIFIKLDNFMSDFLRYIHIHISFSIPTIYMLAFPNEK